MSKTSIRVALGAFIVSSFLPLSAFALNTQGCDSTRLGKVYFGQKSSTVVALQQCLISAGYSLPAGASGYYGSQTRTAVKAFYKDELGIPSWDGLTVGTLGRKALVARAGNPVGPAIGAVEVAGYRRVTSATDLQKLIGTGGSFRELSTTASVDVVRAPSVSADSFAFTSGATPLMAPTSVAEQSSAKSARYSETNAQVTGVDEADIVKTDGKNLYISEQGWYSGGIRPMMPLVDTVGFAPGYPYQPPQTKIVSAYPLAELGIATSSIPETGEMFYEKTARVLVILATPKVVAYDVSDPKHPVRKWSMELASNTSIASSRMTNGKVYLVTQTWLDSNTPCPMIPIMKGPTTLTIACGDIWVPRALEPVNTTYTVLAIDPTTGLIGKSLSVSGDANNTVVSVFPENIYLTYRSERSQSTVILDFFETQLSDFLSPATLATIKKVRGYDISAESQLREIERAFSADVSAMDKDKKLRYQNESANRMTQYVSARLRDMDRSVVTRIPLSSLTIGATASIPGHLLNQFALDEYQGNLRVAVTVGDSWGMSGASSKNDVYVLRSDLSIMGSIRDLGLTERIYSARFVGDRAYLVTFRQTDPFYVLDLKNPANPVLSGELKIPGYSSYLEPLDANTVLGVGMEGNQVKLGLFDVRNPKNPIEKSKYTLSEYWSEVNTNHHAFLRDDTHGVFFIPGSQGGYVFGYQSGVLSLKATIAGESTRRAVYIGDYLYVVGNTMISVLNEITWVKEKEIKI